LGSFYVFLENLKKTTCSFFLKQRLLQPWSDSLSISQRTQQTHEYLIYTAELLLWCCWHDRMVIACCLQVRNTTIVTDGLLPSSWRAMQPMRTITLNTVIEHHGSRVWRCDKIKSLRIRQIPSIFTNPKSAPLRQFVKKNIYGEILQF